MDESSNVDLIREEWARAQFDGQRLRMARELLGLSQEELATAAGVSASAVSQFETGSARPSPSTVASLARELGWDSAGFVKGSSGTDKPAFFRSLRAAPALQRRQSRHYIQLVHDLVVELEKVVRLPIVDIPRLSLEAPADPDAIAAAAATVRSAWSMPRGPVDNVVLEMERHGVVVARPSGGHEQIDAFSVAFSDRPVTLMSPVKKKRDRSRFDMAHELGHLVLHGAHNAADKAAEKDADQFAAAFLMPEEDIRAQLPDRPDWDHLVALKKEWQTSIAALLYRSKTVGPMTPEIYTLAMKTLSARGWRKHEPADLGEPESPALLPQAVGLSGLDEADLSDRTGIPERLLHRVLDSATDDRPEVAI